jgi:1-aminocyclopropane-1-carboxylate deaminase
METLVNSSVQTITFSEWTNSGLIVNVLRDDLIHPYISGNKWRKLKYNVQDFQKSGKKIILSFGGAFSNHLVALAAAGEKFLFKTIGIVRGEEVYNPYIEFLKSKGMKIYFVSRNDYRNKNENDFIKYLSEELIQKKYFDNQEDLFLLPEGGSNQSAVKGCEEIVDDIPRNTNWIACACGTGATIAGISRKLSDHQKALGIQVLKGEGYIKREIENYGGDNDNIIVKEDYHFGGYAKKNDTLIDFCKRFISETGIQIEPVYTGKLFFAINDLIKEHFFKKL